jgi:hypothetical protein
MNSDQKIKLYVVTLLAVVCLSLIWMRETIPGSIALLCFFYTVWKFFLPQDDE